MLTALRSGSFAKIATLYVANSMLEWFGSVALMVVVYNATGSSLAAAALLLCKQVAPGLVVPLLGPALDRSELRRVLTFAFLAGGVALGAAAALGYGVSLYVLAMIAGTCGAIGRSTLRAAVARTLEGDLLRQGNAALNMIMGIAAPIAPGVAALIVGISSPSVALALSGVILVCVAPLALRLGPLPALAADTEDELASASPRSGSGSPIPLFGLLVLAAVVTFAFSMDDPSLMAFSADSLGSGVSGFGAIYTAGGVGITIGSLLFARVVHWPMLRVYAVATGISGFAYLGMGLSPNIELACAFSLLCGIGAGMDWVSLTTAVQEAAPRGHEARAAVRLEAIAMAAPGLGYLAGGALAEFVGPRAALFVPGALALTALLVAGAALRGRSSRMRTAPAPIFSPSIPGGSA